MDDILQKAVKNKIFDYITGALSVPEIYDWVNEQKEFAEALPHIKKKSDIIFFLLNKAGLETRNFYIEKKLTIKKSGIVKNIKRLLSEDITEEDFYNWADDVWNWELVEGYEDQITAIAIEHLNLGTEKLQKLTREDYESVIWHLEKSSDPKLSTSCLNFIFCLPELRNIFRSNSDASAKLLEVGKLKKYFVEDTFYKELVDGIKILLKRNPLIEEWELFFTQIGRGKCPATLI